MFLKYQEKTNHHAKMTIDENKILIETHTKVLNDITELDLELAKFCNELYKDVKKNEIHDERKS